MQPGIDPRIASNVVMNQRHPVEAPTWPSSRRIVEAATADLTRRVRSRPRSRRARRRLHGRRVPRAESRVSDTAELEPLVERILAANPGQVAAYRGGKEGLLGFFVGQAMKETGGKANPKVLNELIREKLSA